VNYCAFISYNRADTAVAKWLLRRLETYRVPKRLVGTMGAHGVIGRRLGKVFRDRDELAAADDLGAVVRAGLADSDALIVICSPAAATSRWVNAEIEAFQKLGRAERIFAYVVAGSPGVAAGPDCPFPPALIARDAADNIQEPMAADARPSGDRRHRAFRKLVAGLLGIGYDALARREAQRRQRTITTVAIASLTGMVIAIGLAAAAYIARNDATRRQAQAEDIMGFMLGDLRNKLTTVGRLDVMRAVDDKATAYFATLHARDISDRALEDQARLLTDIGEERTQEGQQDAALSAFKEAYARSRALYDREPQNGHRLFDLAQDEYWIGWVAFQQARYDDAGLWLRKYRDSGVKLAAMDRTNFDWQKEVAYGVQNLAILDERLGHYDAAEKGIQDQLALYKQWLAQRPNDVALRYEATNAAAWLGSVDLKQGKLSEAQAYFAAAVDGLNQNIAAEPANQEWKGDVIDTLVLLASAQAALGERTLARANAGIAAATALAMTVHDAANNHWRQSLGTAVLWQAILAPTIPDGAERAIQAVQLLEAARGAEPKNEQIQRHLALALDTEARRALDWNDPVTARRDLTQSFAILDPMWQQTHREDLRSLLAQTYLLDGDIAARDHDRDSAVSAWKHAQDLLEEKDPVNPTLPFPRLEHLVHAMYRLGETAAAAPYRDRLDAAGFVPLEPFTADSQRATVGRNIKETHDVHSVR
jgi:tetratricopeptide (TPR) repeat protein